MAVRMADLTPSSRLKLARARMMSEVPKADVVVVNPEHFAAALSYREDRMRAPRLVAKNRWGPSRR